MKTALYRLKDNFAYAADGIGYLLTQYTKDSVYEVEVTPVEHLNAMEIRGILEYLSEDEIKKFIKEVKEQEASSQEFNEQVGDEPISQEETKPLDNNANQNKHPNKGKR
jgi:ABC-type Zn uptake system ZnuABC Zn-binding protein ZnuA